MLDECGKVGITEIGNQVPTFAWHGGGQNTVEDTLRTAVQYGQETFGQKPRIIFILLPGNGRFVTLCYALLSPCEPPVYASLVQQSTKEHYFTMLLHQVLLYCVLLLCWTREQRSIHWQSHLCSWWAPSRSHSNQRVLFHCAVKSACILTESSSRSMFDSMIQQSNGFSVAVWVVHLQRHCLGKLELEAPPSTPDKCDPGLTPKRS